jgi:hypothetical protein
MTSSSSRLLVFLQGLAFSTGFAALNQRLEAAIAPTLLKPDLLAWTDVSSLLPSVILQGLEPITIGALPQRNAIPLAVRFWKRDRHIAILHSL